MHECCSIHSVSEWERRRAAETHQKWYCLWTLNEYLSIHIFGYSSKGNVWQCGCFNQYTRAQIEKLCGHADSVWTVCQNQNTSSHLLQLLFPNTKSKRSQRDRDRRSAVLSQDWTTHDNCDCTVTLALAVWAGVGQWDKNGHFTTWTFKLQSVTWDHFLAAKQNNLLTQIDEFKMYTQYGCTCSTAR